MYRSSDGLLVFDTDNPADIAILIAQKREGPPQVIPRVYAYGSPEAYADGLEPIEESPDVLIQPSDYGDALKVAHEQQIMPYYHMRASWRPPGQRYTQDGLGYCWTFGGTGCLMTTRSLEGKPLQLLAPTSMGFLVGWQNRGNYLSSYIKGAREVGVCPAKDWSDVNSTNINKRYWDEVGQRDKYRLDKVWDTRGSAMVQHCISGFCYGRSCYGALNWWNHALECCGVRMDSAGKLEWIWSNSHNEPEPIILTGSKAVPDEAYFFISTVLV